MLSNFKIPEKSDSKEAAKEIKVLQKKLAVLQQKVKDLNIPVIIIVDGWSASGKGRAISSITSQMEPRSYKVFATKLPEGDDARKPWLSRFWRDTPARGSVAIYDRGWYLDALSYVVDDDINNSFTDSICRFERQLADDGYIICKFFLHIGQEEQFKRMDELEKSSATSWRVNDRDWEQNRRYSTWFNAKNELLNLTSNDYAPWDIIWNEEKNCGILKMLKLLCKKLQKAVDGEKPDTYLMRFPPDVNLLKMPKLSEVDLEHAVKNEEYDERLKSEKKKLQELHSLLYREKLPIVAAFEGWDASGKGGAIRRLSWSLDPRGFAVSSIAGPTADELAHHYLWRFWNKLPKNGHISVFDRSWYGRVMVERIEGYTPEERWSQAFDEINEFEKELTDWGAIVLKFWIQVDKQTQLDRFMARQEDPEKRYKITDEDWRNRAKWELYEEAVDEMIAKTSTELAPWIIVEGNDKKFARLRVIKEFRKAIEKRLGIR